MKIIKKYVALLLCLMMTFGLLSTGGMTLTAYAQDEEELSWVIEETTGTLIVAGVSAIENYSTSFVSGKYVSSAPWGDKADSINYIVIGDDVETVGENAFYGCNQAKAVTIGRSVKTLCASAFGYCTSLSSITIPEGVTEFAGNPFVGCSSLEKIEVNDNNKNLCSVSGIVFSKDRTKLICYPAGIKSTSFGIPSFCSTIAPNAFVNCSNLTSLLITEEVTLIDEEAIVSCENLMAIVFMGPTSVSSVAVDDCDKMTKVFVIDNGFNLKADSFPSGTVIYGLNNNVKNKVTSKGYTFKMATASEEVAVAPECTKYGLSNLNVNFKDEYENSRTMTIGLILAPLGHDPQPVEEKEGVCENDGNLSYYKCSRCDTCFSDAEGTNIIEESTMITPAPGHDYKTQNFDKSGHWLVCSCGAKDEVKEHTFGEWSTVTEATLDSSGLEKRNCTVCGYEETNTIPKIRPDYKIGKLESEKTAIYKTDVTLTVTLKDVPEGYDVFINGEKAQKSENGKYSVNLGQLSADKKITVSVSRGSDVLDSAQITVKVKTDFVSKMISFFSNFVFNGFKWKKSKIEF